MILKTDKLSPDELDKDILFIGLLILILAFIGMVMG